MLAPRKKVYTCTNRVSPSSAMDGKTMPPLRDPEFFACCRGPLHVPVRTRVAG